MLFFKTIAFMNSSSVYDFATDLAFLRQFGKDTGKAFAQYTVYLDEKNPEKKRYIGHHLRKVRRAIADGNLQAKEILEILFPKRYDVADKQIKRKEIISGLIGN